MLLTPYLKAYDGLTNESWRIYNPGRNIGIFRHRFITHDYLTLALLIEGHNTSTMAERNMAINATVEAGEIVEITRHEKKRCNLQASFSLYRIPHASPIAIAGDEVEQINHWVKRFYGGYLGGLACGSLVPMDKLLGKVGIDYKQGAIEYLIQRGDLLEAPSEFLREQRLYGRHLYSPAHHHLIYN